MTPTARSLATLRKDGYTADVAERWLPRIGVRKDLFGCIDLVAVRPSETGVLGIQATTAGNLSSRLRKARTEPRLAVWLSSGNRFQCWGWKKIGNRWHVRKVALIGADLAEVPLAVLPRRRRRGRGERQRELFADGQ